MGAGLRPEEKFAAASLFTLALHATQVDGGLAAVAEGDGLDARDMRAWGHPPDEDELQLSDLSSDDMRALNDAAWAAFWGWDCCGPNGLLERVYRNLGISQRAWPGLKQLPEIGGLSVNSQQTYIQLVRAHMGMLDASLAEHPVPVGSSHGGSCGSLASHGDIASESAAPGAPARNSGTPTALSDSQPSPAKTETALLASTTLPDFLSSASLPEPELAWPQEVAPEGGISAAATEQPNSHRRGAAEAMRTAEIVPDASEPVTRSGELSDESDLEEDRRRAAAAKAAARKRNFAGKFPSVAAEPAAGNAGGTPLGSAVPLGRDLLSGDATPGGSVRSGTAEDGASADGLEVQGPLAEGAPMRTHPLQAAYARAQAQLHRNRPFQAGPSPVVVEAVWELLDACVAGIRLQGAEEAAGGGRGRRNADKFAEWQPRARWYDARARTALKRVAGWLRVPWSKAVTFETLLAHQAAAGEGRRAPAAQRSAASWAKIGAASVGAGALFAVTGGLAAPALAAGLGSVVALGGTTMGIAGASAAGGTVSAALGTTAGAALLGGSIGIAGGNYSGNRMAKRVGMLKEFGFWALPELPAGRAARGRGASPSPTEAPAPSTGTASRHASAADLRLDSTVSATRRNSGTVSHEADGQSNADGNRWNPSHGAASRTAAPTEDLINFQDEPPADSRSSSIIRQLSTRLGEVPTLHREPPLVAAKRSPHIPSTCASGGSHESADLSDNKEQGSFDSTVVPNIPEPRPEFRATPDTTAAASTQHASQRGPHPLPSSPPPTPPGSSPSTAKPATAAADDSNESWADFEAFSRGVTGTVRSVDPAAVHDGAAVHAPPPDVDLREGTTSPDRAWPWSSDAQGHWQNYPQQEEPDPGSPMRNSHAGSPSQESASPAHPAHTAPSNTATPPSSAAGWSWPWATNTSSGEGPSPPGRSHQEQAPAQQASTSSAASRATRREGRSEAPSGGAAQDGRKWWKLPSKAQKPEDVSKRPLLLAPFDPQRVREDNLQLCITICVSGWITRKSDFLTMWNRVALPDSERYTLVWESKDLIELNQAVTDTIKSTAAYEVGKFAVSKLVAVGLVAAVALPMALMMAASFIDTPWAVVMDRAMKAGRLLAHVLMSGAHGDRPVRLIGHSMGARVIFHALLELCRHNCKGVVEEAVLLGAPVSIRGERWTMARSAVAGRFVNGFSRRDWVLGLVHRGSNGFVKGVGGISPVDCPGVENINMTKIIGGHFDWSAKIDEVVELLELSA